MIVRRMVESSLALRGDRHGGTTGTSSIWQGLEMDLHTEIRHTIHLTWGAVSPSGSAVSSSSSLLFQLVIILVPANRLTFLKCRHDCSHIWHL